MDPCSPGSQRLVEAQNAYPFTCRQVRVLPVSWPSCGLLSEAAGELHPTLAKVARKPGREDRMAGGRRRNPGQGIKTEIVGAD